MLQHLLSMFIALNVAPTGARYLGLYNESGVKLGTVEYAADRQDDGDIIYKFGVLSDVHLGGDVSSSMNNLYNALSYFKNIEEAEFSVISGDIALSYGSAEPELNRYVTVLSQLPGCIVYPTTGNHDCPESEGASVNITRFKEKTGITNLFKPDATNSYEVTKVHTLNDGTLVCDHFLMLGMNNSKQIDGKWFQKPYLDTDLDWLERKLDTYKNDRCFIVTHPFFPNGAGNLRGRYNWLVLHGTQLNRLLYMRYTHPNTFWLSGHSHWDLRYQNIERNANIDPISNVGRAEGWAIHDGSCTRVRWYQEGGNNGQYEKASQGSVFYVYKDAIEIRGIVFKENTGSYSTNYVPIATYRLPTNPVGIVQTNIVSITENMVRAVSGKTAPTVTVNNNTHNVSITFSESNQSVAFYKEDDPEKNRQTIILYDALEWTPFPPYETAKDEIGFLLDGMHKAGNPDYSVESGILVDTSLGGFQVGTSASYVEKGGTTITLTFKNLRYATIGN